MRWGSPRWRRLSEWRWWFAWYPVRVPPNRFVPGQLVWLEWVEYRAPGYGDVEYRLR